MEENFLVQVSDKPARGKAFLVLCTVPVQKSSLKGLWLEAAGDVVVTPWLSSGSQGLQASKEKLWTLKFGRVKFQILKGLVDEMAGETP